MNLQQAKIILEKINTLYKNISLDAENISAIERDLMLNYVRQLYESLLSEQQVKAPVYTPPPVATPEPIVEKVEVPAAPVRKKPRIVEVPDSIKEYAKPPAPEVKKAAPAKAEVVTPAPAPKKTAAPKKSHAVLFEHEEAKELSDKLSAMPIKDLTTAMGLNEKILTINELFGGDHRAFDEAIRDLNTLKTFDAAKDYLSENLAEKYNWSDRSRKKKAQIFIKLIRRRYN